MKAALLIDVGKCIGCRGCTEACKEANGLPHTDDGMKLSATTWTTVEDKAGFHVRRQCMHCEEPACASVCPVGALHKTDEGPVVYDEDKCLGCRYCMVACPFGIPKYEWSKNVPRVRKCIMCHEQSVRKGKPTACASVCPTGATTFGERPALIAEAQKRIDSDPGHYVNRIFGLREVGGTSVLYLSPVEFEKLGMPVALHTASYPQLTWSVLSRLPKVVSVTGVAMAGVWWIMNRRETVPMEEARLAEEQARAKDNRSSSDKETP
jgi:formate dehydrogenase iron-sulfur subunit